MEPNANDQRAVCIFRGGPVAFAALPLEVGAISRRESEMRGVPRISLHISGKLDCLTALGEANVS